MIDVHKFGTLLVVTKDSKLVAVAIVQKRTKHGFLIRHAKK